jgi:peptidoglycan/xylan/chitin deacetylase (PgdA/CDA1 family)
MGYLASVNGIVHREGLKRVAKRALRLPPVGRAVRTIAALRGHSLVLVYHQVVSNERLARAIVPTVSTSRFRRHLEALAEIGDIAPLAALVSDLEWGARPRFALTFDDDIASHVERTLPILQALDVPATFFLSGRALHGLGSYWFERLERLIEVRGVKRAACLLGMHTEELDQIVAACEDDPVLQKVLEATAEDEPPRFGRAHIEALASAGMSVGFHTLHHRPLTVLSDAELAAALNAGRRELEDVVRQPIVHFAYPHGKANRQTAARVRDAGFEAAWTGHPTAMARGDEPYMLGRWEPGDLSVDEFVVAVSITLNRRAGV